MPPADVTALLREAESRPEALDRLLPLVYDELRALARRERRRMAPHETLATTALVHEAYLRLVDGGGAGWNDRTHFLRVAARAMRHLLVDDARRRAAAKRGSGTPLLPLDAAAVLAYPDATPDLVALDEALGRLERLDPQLGRVVECRFFAGLTVDETAATLGLSVRTVERAWTTSKAWLFRDLRSAAP